MLISEQVVVYKLICLNFPLAPSFPVPPASELYFAVFQIYFFLPRGAFAYGILIPFETSYP